MSFEASATPGTESVGTITRSHSAFLQAAIAMAFGALIVGMAGFSHIDAIHNAAHDTRHSNAFPCH
jgi:cobalt transporter subunit CbtB